MEISDVKKEVSPPRLGFVKEFSTVYYIYYFYLIINSIVLRDVCLRKKNYNENQGHDY